LSGEKEAALRRWDGRWDWTAHDRRWEERFRQLVAYRDRRGDCCVPVRNGHNGSRQRHGEGEGEDLGGGGGDDDDAAGLGAWVSAQRKALRHLRLDRRRQDPPQQRQQQPPPPPPRSPAAAAARRDERPGARTDPRRERRFRRLESIGFVWSVQEHLASQWERL
jgi:hypothetical protein